MTENNMQKFIHKYLTLQKKVLRLFSFLVFICLVIWGITEAYIYQTDIRQKNKVQVSLKPSDTCPEGFPIAVIIVNGSNRTIKNTKIYPNAQREGYSKNLASYDVAIESDRIIPSGKGHSFCWYGQLNYDVQSQYKPKELIWGAESFYVDFEELSIREQIKLFFSLK
jgi:hypothetical protein